MEHFNCRNNVTMLAHKITNFVDPWEIKTILGRNTCTCNIKSRSDSQTEGFTLIFRLVSNQVNYSKLFSLLQGNK